MKASKDCYQLIRHFEGLRSAPYLCPAGVPTIGYGSTRYADGRKVTLADAHITQAQAEELLTQTLHEYEDFVTKAVTVQLTQGKFDALVDFAYNLGPGKLQSSTLLKLTNMGKFQYASQEFLKWVHCDGKILQGLMDRREQERKLFDGTGG